MDPAWIAVVGVLITSVGAPWLLARQASKGRLAEKAADNARQDELADRVSKVAARAEEAAKLLVRNTADVKEAATVVSSTLAESTKTTNDKLDVIHLLVNSNMTVAKQAEYDATVSQLAMMHEVVELKQAAGKEPNAMTIAALAATETKIADLRKELDERARQAKAVEKQQDIQKQEALAVKIGELPNGTTLDTDRPLT